jgi:hypothetical protein
MQGILLVIQHILGGIDIILRSLLLDSLPLNHFPPDIFCWFSIQIHSLMARLLEIPFGIRHAGGVQLPPRELRLGIWFPFLLEGNLLDEYGSKGPREKWMDRLEDTKSRLVSKGFQ